MRLRSGELPHRLVEWLDMVESLDAKALIFNGIVCSSVTGEAPTALDEVRERDDFASLSNSFHFQRDRIEGAKNIVPRWAWSRLRVYLDRLHVPN